MTAITGADLHGPARKLYESWRDLGRTDAEALEEVRRSGIVEEQRKADVGDGSVALAEVDASIARAFGRTSDEVSGAAMTVDEALDVSILHHLGARPASAGHLAEAERVLAADASASQSRPAEEPDLRELRRAYQHFHGGLSEAKAEERARSMAAHLRKKTTTPTALRVAIQEQAAWLSSTTEAAQRSSKGKRA